MTPGCHDAVLVYDVGGSHVSAAVCVEGSWQLGHIVRSLHASGQSLQGFVDLLWSLGTEAANGTGIAGAALAVPGPFDFEAGVSLMRHKLNYLYGVSLRHALAQRFGWQGEQVRFLHDAAAFMLGEVAAGAACGVPRAVGITLGTGIGSAFSLNGRVITDGEGIPPGGEIWDIPYEAGILEDAVSTRGIQASYRQHTNRLCDVADLAASAGNDPAAAAAFDEFGRNLGLGLRMALAGFAPDVVVLGGGISRSAHLFLPQARLELEDLNFDLRVSALLDEAPLIGAGSAWFNWSSEQAVENQATVAE